MMILGSSYSNQSAQGKGRGEGQEAVAAAAAVEQAHTPVGGSYYSAAAAAAAHIAWPGQRQVRGMVRPCTSTELGTMQ